MSERVFNFSAGPSVMPESVLTKAGSEILNYGGSGMSVMEMSHRSAAFIDIFNNVKATFKSLMNVPDSHEVLFLQGGATAQFAAIPMNLMKSGSADYAVTGHFSNKAAAEAEKYGSVHIACDTSAENHRHIPAQSQLSISDGSDYFYYCANNTIYGTQWQYVPSSAAPIVCDMSSEILSKPVDVNKYGLIYAGAQKNMAPAGLTVVIIDKSLAGHEMPITPEIFSYKEMISKDSMLNTPPCWCIYMLGLTCDWVRDMGGLSAMEELSIERSRLIYDVLDNSRFYTSHADKNSRSRMNVTFRTPSDALDAEFVKGAAAQGLVNLKGHKKTGGLRASLYNAMPVEGAVKLSEYMKKFEVDHV